MGYKDWVEVLLKLLTKNTGKVLLQGTNKKKYWTVEAHEDKKIILSKERHLILRNMEFVFRIYFTGVLFVVLNHLFLCNVTKVISMYMGAVPYIFTDSETRFIALPFIFSMYAATGIQHMVSFEEGLIGVGLNSKKLKLLKGIMIALIVCSCILNSLLFWYNMEPFYLFLYGCYSFIVLSYFFLQIVYLHKRTIYCFRSGSKYSDPNPKLVRLDQDISIELKQGKELQINLLTNNLYISDNDDILVLANHVNAEPKRYYKESIKSLKIKDTRVIYDGNKWVKS